MVCGSTNGMPAGGTAQISGDAEYGLDALEPFDRDAAVKRFGFAQHQKMEPAHFGPGGRAGTAQANATTAPKINCYRFPARVIWSGSTCFGR
jgi:hypothetical protein